MDNLKQELRDVLCAYFPSAILAEYHIQGFATFRDEEDFRQFGAKHRTGILTCWLPKHNEDGTSKIAVFFGTGQLITFDWDETEFLKRFEVDFNYAKI